MHYTGMAALQVPTRMSYNPALLMLSVIIAIVAATVALWFTLRLRGIWSTLGAALIMGVAVSGMHYTGMAAMHMSAERGSAGMVMNGATATEFLLPLILGISILTFLVTATIALSPTDTEIRAEGELMNRINAARAAAEAPAPYLTHASARRPVIFPGGGVRIAGAYDDFVKFVERLGVPAITAFNAHDLLAHDHPLYAGRPGTIGDRAGNFVVQNADYVLVLGCRLSMRQISYNWDSFARHARLAMVSFDATHGTREGGDPSPIGHQTAAIESGRGEPLSVLRLRQPHGRALLGAARRGANADRDRGASAR